MRYLVGFVFVLALVASPLGVSAQTAGEVSASELAPEEPALQLKLDDAGVEVAPTPLRTPDGYTLEEMDVRVRRAKIGLGSSAAAVFAGGMFVGVGIGEAFGHADTVPKRYIAYVWTGTALLVGGFVGMVASGILLRRRKFDWDWLRQAHYATPRRVQWDVARSRVVF